MFYITDGVQRMTTMIEQLLQYTRANRNKENYELDSVDLNDVLEGAVFYLNLMIKETNTTIKKVQLPTVKAYYAKMVQVFQNLISNAIKFRGTEAPVIEFAVETDPDFTVISIKDNGIGIDEEDQNKVFDIFFRSRSVENRSGTGLGLAIVRKVMESFGGKITLLSQKNKGTTFYLYFPNQILVQEESN
jgi:signal transduction histidine kinase